MLNFDKKIQLGSGLLIIMTLINFVFVGKLLRRPVVGARLYFGQIATSISMFFSISAQMRRSALTFEFKVFFSLSS